MTGRLGAVSQPVPVSDRMKGLAKREVLFYLRKANMPVCASGAPDMPPAQAVTEARAARRAPPVISSAANARPQEGAAIPAATRISVDSSGAA